MECEEGGSGQATGELPVVLGRRQGAGPRRQCPCPGAFRRRDAAGAGNGDGIAVVAPCPAVCRAGYGCIAGLARPA